MAKRTQIKPRILLLPILISVYAGLLQWTYEFKIAPAFSYLGSRFREPDVTNYLLAFLLILALAILLPRRLQRASDFVVWMLYVTTVIPAALVPQYADIIGREDSLILAFVVVANFAFVLVLSSRVTKLPHLRLKIRSDLLWLGVAVVSATIFAYIFVTSGLNVVLIQEFNDVRDIRFGYRAQIAGGGGALLGYLIQLQGNVLNPLIITKGGMTGRWWLVGVGSFGQLLIFSETGYKLVLLSPLAIIALVVLFRRNPVRPGRVLLSGFIISSMFAIVWDQLRGGALVLTEVLVDRLLLIPGTLTAAHVLVFQNQDKALWGYSFMAPFVDYPYSTTPAFMVGAQFNGSEVVSANANFFADGYANLGYAGMTVEAIVLVFILWALNSASQHLPVAVVACLALLPTLSLANSSVFTNLLTGGSLAVVLLMTILPEEGWRPPTSAHARDETEPSVAIEGALHK